MLLTTRNVHPSFSFQQCLPKHVLLFLDIPPTLFATSHSSKMEIAICNKMTKYVYIYIYSIPLYLNFRNIVPLCKWNLFLNGRVRLAILRLY